MAFELAAVKIAEIAFGKLVETAVGKGIEASLEKLKPLQDKIRHRLKGDAHADVALMEVEKNPSGPNLDRVATFLDAAMRTDKPFADEIQTMAQQINREINLNKVEDNSTKTQINDRSSKTVQASDNAIGEIGKIDNPGTIEQIGGNRTINHNKNI
ncbi:hypothetical protein [Aerosakkonema funiforme]|uniref:Uncharacterized protein n=1 Tax=Aerosakkonema funiforme FACHB-1375 TaxID=2949571 RepID=A0A926VLD5_9CYAN|nr:hypothetical protein [Aerosakkonema funiforme]MBD2186055.1 hypothetical protein [Aerosakkonema funiforme FACHB-1375]